MFIPTHLYLLEHTLAAAQFNEVDLVPCEVRLDKEQDYAASCDAQYQMFGTQVWKIAMFGPIFLTTNFWLWPPATIYATACGEAFPPAEDPKDGIDNW
jgi:hypothetical protein